MLNPWKKLLSGIEQNPERSDLVSGVVCLCRTMQNPIEQSRLLSQCAALILQAQPLLSLQLLRLALLLAPREALALQIAKEVFRRRGRFAAEQRVGELLATLTNASAVTPAPLEVSGGSTQTRTTIATSLSPYFEEGEDIPKNEVTESVSSTINDTPVEIDWLSPEEIHSAVSSVEQPSAPLANESSDAIDFIPEQPEADAAAAQPTTGGDIFLHFLKQGSYDVELQKFSAGFSPNFAGLVAYVNMLFTMRLLEEHEKANALIILYRTIKEKDDNSGAEELFDRLFMQRKAQKEE
ncbi:MAG: hypothetical protein RLZZ488_158 [Pseudomonadota bacterium]